MLTRHKKLRTKSDTIEEAILKEAPKRTKQPKKKIEVKTIEGGIAKSIFMVEPTQFCTNIETLKDNYFMKNADIPDIQNKALAEFTNFVDQVKEKNINVNVFKQCHPDAADSVFPNNWFSTHKNEFIPDGIFILYPMKSEKRRLERNPEFIEKFKINYKHFIDLSYLEKENEYLESTGTLIFDNNNRKIYCAVSERATKRALDIFIESFNKFTSQPYELITFNSFDKNDRPIYHTNCLMSVLEKHVVVCLNSIKNKEEREKVRKSIEISEKNLIDLTFKEMENFCANIINVKKMMIMYYMLL